MSRPSGRPSVLARGSRKPTLTYTAATDKRFRRHTPVPRRNLDKEGSETRILGLSRVGGGNVGTELAEMQSEAQRHLWMHFTRMSSYADHEVPVIVRGQGPYVYDQ